MTDLFVFSFLFLSQHLKIMFRRFSPAYISHLLERPACRVLYSYKGESCSEAHFTNCEQVLSSVYLHMIKHFFCQQSGTTQLILELSHLLSLVSETSTALPNTPTHDLSHLNFPLSYSSANMKPT